MEAELALRAMDNQTVVHGAMNLAFSKKSPKMSATFP